MSNDFSFAVRGQVAKAGDDRKAIATKISPFGFRARDRPHGGKYLRVRNIRRINESRKLVLKALRAQNDCVFQLFLKSKQRSHYYSRRLVDSSFMLANVVAANRAKRFADSYRNDVDNADSAAELYSSVTNVRSNGDGGRRSRIY